MLAAHSNLVAELADFLVTDDEHGFVFAEFGFAGDKHETVVHIGRLRVAGEELEVHVALAVGIQQERTERTEILIFDLRFLGLLLLRDDFFRSKT